MKHKYLACLTVFSLFFLKADACHSDNLYLTISKRSNVNGVVTQVRSCDGIPYRCWELKNATVKISDKENITWEDTRSKSIVHVVGPYVFVEVKENKWDNAFSQIGLTRKTCAEVQNRTYDAESDVCGD